MTHFIEQYVASYTRNISSTMPLPLDCLERALYFTAKSKGLTTVAVFKIKLK
jgi:hypothetical protein